MSEKHALSRRDFLRLTAAAATGAVMAACAPAAPQVVEVEKQVPVREVVVQTVEVEKVVEKVVEKKVEVREPVTIAFWGWTSREEKDIVERFEHPYIKVNLSELGEAVFGDQKYLTAVAAGKGPDAAIQNRHTFMQFAAKGLYMDVTAFFEQEGLKTEDYFPVQFEETCWAGKIHGLPRNTDVRILYWNKEHFREVGLDPETPPGTWAELEEYTARLNKRDAEGNWERMGFIPYYGNTWMWLYGFLNKAPAISEDKRTILCDDERWVEALQWMVDFYDNYLDSFEMSAGFQQGYQTAELGLFELGRVSMVGHGDWMLRLFARLPDLEYGAAPMPIPPEGEMSSWSCGWSAVVSAAAKHPEAAWEFVKWWTGIEGHRAAAEARNAETVRRWERDQIKGEPIYVPAQAVYIPAAEMLEEEYVSKCSEKIQEEYALCMDCLMNWTHGCGTEMGLAALQYWVEIDNAVRVATAHEATPREAMSACQDKVQKATDEAWEAVEQAG